MTNKVRESNYFYNKELKQRASDLRNNMTKAECCLWKYILKAGKMKGYSFNRQRPVLNYIVDFMCKELMLIIEVDGISHTFDEVERKDFIKQKELENIGFTVLRFSDGEILRAIGDVSKTIENFINNFENK